jgi:hypothetical protein
MQAKVKLRVNALLPLLVLGLFAFATPVGAQVIQRFVDCTLVGPGAYPLTFNQLNWPSANGHLVMLGGDGDVNNPKWWYVKEAGNFVCAYYNTLNDPGYLQRTATQKADDIEAYLRTVFNGDGGGGYAVGIPTWLVINEISNGLWPDNQTYRTWVRGVASRLRNVYGHKVIMLAPFETALSNNADWQGLATNAYIGIEAYLSGREIRAQNYSVSWCQNYYQASKNSYLARGIPASKLFLVEHFGWTPSTASWGRASVLENEWHQAINARSQAADNVGFAGFIGYGWGSYDETNFAPDYFDAHQWPFADTFNNYNLP